MNLGTGPIGAELISHPARRGGGGGAPWEREGAGLHSPDDPQSRQAAQRWATAAATVEANERDAEAARLQREQARRQRREDADRANAQKLEDTSKRMLLIGFAGLPFVWLVSLIYFREEVRNPEANPKIKKST